MKNKPKTPVEKEKIIEKVPFSLNEEQKNTRLFSINLKNGKGFSSKNATLEKFNFCLKNHCIGIGFTDFINSGLENPALEESKKTLLEMRKGDLVWIKHPQKDLHYIATIQSEAKPTFSNPAFEKNDLSFCCGCEFQKIGSMKNLKSAYGDFFDEFLSEKEIESKELDPHRTLLYEMMEVKKQESIRKRKNLLIKYPLLGVIGLVTLVALVIGILCVSRFIQRSPLVEEMPSKVAGKTYVGDDFYIALDDSIIGNALIFDEEASQYFIWIYTVPSDSSSITSLCIGKYYPVKFSVNPFGKHVSLERLTGKGEDFYFTDENSITWGTDTYSTENISNLYLHLVSYLDSEQSKEDENRSLFQQLMQSLEQNQPELKTAKKNYQKEKEKQLALTKLEKALKTNRIYNSTVYDLMGVCIVDSKLDEYKESSPTYTFTFNCKYRPNAYDISDFYDTGTLTIKFNANTEKLTLSGEVAEAMQTYAVLKYGDSFGSYYY